ncbi:hypothetical protein RND71_023344 [Anisodus tanguticus]|uniref:RRM domain-containing protein n=1 Tax=Anisodus tanguticus TaxID=243964 RepID=A0AAE1RSE8_9SOLA|nr:hypothetical protein RND71_023344 [Anisodus tanguticus]
MTVDDESSIYVGGLPYSATEETLRRVFDIYGAVIDTKIINDRKVGGKCYGFVTFTNPRSAMHAITEMDGRTVEGRVVKVNEVTTRGGRSGFGRESIRHYERGVKGGERGHWERGYDRDENRHRENSRDRDHKRERGYDRPRDHGRSRDSQVNRDKVVDDERSLEDVEQEDERIRENSRERERDQPIKMQKTNSNHESRDREKYQMPKLLTGSYLDDHVSRERSAESSENDQHQVEMQLEISSRKVEELKKEVSSIEELVNEKQNLVSKLHERSKKLEDSLTAAKNLTSQRQKQLSKLYKHYAQVGECGERLKISEQELQVSPFVPYLDGCRKNVLYIQTFD